MAAESVATRTLSSEEVLAELRRQGVTGTVYEAVKKMASTHRELTEELDVFGRVSSAYIRINASMPTIRDAIEGLGKKEEAQALSLAQWALDEAEQLLEPIWDRT